MLLQGCCHNPTGADPTMDQWKELSLLLQQHKVIPFFDLAYQGFGDSLDADAAAVVVSEDQPEYRALLTGMQGRWPDTMYRTMDDPAKWDSVREAFDVHKTGPIVRAVAEVAESLV